MTRRTRCRKGISNSSALGAGHLHRSPKSPAPISGISGMAGEFQGGFGAKLNKRRTINPQMTPSIKIIYTINIKFVFCSCVVSPSQTGGVRPFNLVPMWPSQWAGVGVSPRGARGVWGPGLDQFNFKGGFPGVIRNFKGLTAVSFFV